ncbi:uncharacterized protein ATC70_003488 [Mucor velutinosus]|uniref:SH3 domain-containing protein n=1 Tax=Mucor velutinosus TaxID=708070 RepID=A0AAN7HYY3_9FUNG|nr:hypothetical protein ATC70_003488 [Mucor velutinosus]
MSLNNVIAFALLLKKITRKGSLGKKNFQQRMRKNNTSNANGTSKTEAVKKQDVSVSSCSSSETEEEDEVEQVYSNHHHQDFNKINKKSSLIVDTAPSIKSLQASQIKVALRTSVIVDEANMQLENEVAQVVVATPTPDFQKSSISLSSTKTTTAVQNVIIRDFAYPTDSPLHFGRNMLASLNNQSAVSLSSPDFNGRDARALFDFSPETEYEIALKAGQCVWVQYRQCPGWLIADVQDETGLIPESYVEFI